MAQNVSGFSNYTPTTTYRPATTTYNPFGLAGAARPATPTPTPTPTQPTYAQKVMQQFTQQPQTYTGYPQSYGLAGAGQAAAPKPAPAPTPAAPAAPAATPAAAAPASTSTNPGGTYVNGQWIPNITQTTTLSPAEQDLLNQQQGLQKQAGTLTGTLMGNVPTTPMSFANAPAMPTGGQFNQQASDAAYQEQTNMLDPQWQQQEQQLEDQLRDQGIPPGSDAYNQAKTLFQNQKTTAYQQAKDSAIQEGYNVSNQQFQQGMAARQQGVAEAQNLYQQPANTLAQLYGAYQGGGGVQAPQANYQPASVAPTDIAGIQANYQNAANQAYQNQVQQQSSTIGGISGLAGMLAMGAMA